MTATARDTTWVKAPIRALWYEPTCVPDAGEVETVLITVENQYVGGGTYVEGWETWVETMYPEHSPHSNCHGVDYHIDGEYFSVRGAP